MKSFNKSNKILFLVGFGIILLIPNSIVFANENFEKDYVCKSPEITTFDESYGNNSEKSDFTADIVEDLRDLGFVISYNKTAIKEITEYERLSDPKDPNLDPWNLVHNPFARVTDDMYIENDKTVAAHQAFLENSTGIDQDMQTASFEYSQTDSVTTITSNAVGGAVTTSTEMEFPFVSGSISMEVRYDFSHTREVASNVEKKWTVPSQTISVPAGKKYKVEWVLKMGTARGTTDLTSRVSGIVPFKKIPGGVIYGYSLGNAINEQVRLTNILQGSAYQWTNRSYWERIDGITALRKWTNSKYEAKIGTALEMKVSDATNGNLVSLKTVPMNLTPEIVE